MPKYKLIYFNSRGRGEVARLLFSLAEVEFQDVRIEYGSDEWLELKPKTPLGQLPVLEVDGKQLVQSKAIFRYLAREFGYYGRNNWDCARIDAIIDTCEDFHSSVVPILTSQGTEKERLLRIYQKEVVQKTLVGLESFLTQDKYFIGDHLTVADLIAYCDIELASVVAEVTLEDLLKGYPRLASLIVLVQTNDKIASWIKKRPKTVL